MTSHLRSRPVARTVASVGALAVLVAGGLTACASSTTGAGLIDTASTSSTPVSSTTSVASPTASQPAATDDLAAAVLRVGEIGHGFVATDSDTSDSPLPCTPDSPGLLTAVPPKAQGAADFASREQDKQITERLAQFDTAQTATKALALVRKGFGCATTNIGGDRIDFVGPTDFADILGEQVDEAQFWQVRTAAYEAEVFVVRDGDRLMLLQFSYLTGGKPTQVDQTAVLDTAIKKVQGAG